MASKHSLCGKSSNIPSGHNRMKDSWRLRRNMEEERSANGLPLEDSKVKHKVRFVFSAPNPHSLRYTVLQMMASRAHPRIRTFLHP